MNIKQNQIFLYSVQDTVRVQMIADSLGQFNIMPAPEVPRYPRSMIESMVQKIKQQVINNDNRLKVEYDGTIVVSPHRTKRV